MAKCWSQIWWVCNAWLRNDFLILRTEEVFYSADEGHVFKPSFRSPCSKMLVIAIYSSLASGHCYTQSSPLLDHWIASLTGVARALPPPGAVEENPTPLTFFHTHIRKTLFFFLTQTTTMTIWWSIIAFVLKWLSILLYVLNNTVYQLPYTWTRKKQKPYKWPTREKHRLVG